MMIRVLLFFLILFMSPVLSLAKDLEKLNSIQSAVNRGSDRALSKVEDIFYIEDSSIESSEVKRDKRLKKERRKLPIDEISLLLEEINSLKKKEIEVKRKAIFTETIKGRSSIGTKTVFNYEKGKIFEIHCGVNRVTEIELESGEVLTDIPVSGDTIRWKIKAIHSGKGALKKTHLIIKPTETHIETNIIIPTNRRMYHLKVKSSNWYMAGVSWNYPQASKSELKDFIKDTDVEIEFRPEDLNFNYKIIGDDYSWRPERVFDDGNKTYFKMHSSISSLEAPVLFLLNEDDEATLTNYRVKGDFYIIDRLIYRAQMRVGKNRVIEIRSTRYKESFWERIF